MKKIPLTGKHGKGKFALVDDEDFKTLSRWKWYCSFQGYAARDRSFLMHRIIMEPPEGMEVDHSNGDTLDNRRSNLRICTRSQNNANHRLQSNSTSGYKGVSLHKRGGIKIWRAYIKRGGRQISLGCYTTAKEAHEAYKSAAKKHFGEFARTK